MTIGRSTPPPPTGPSADLVVSLGSGRRTPDAEQVSAALLGLAGVVRVHLDPHHTWALIGYRPDETSAEAIVTELTRLGLVVLRARPFTEP